MNWRTNFPNESLCPIVLGTAQFGSAYGIANKTGLPGQATATATVQEAWENGIREFDTAQGYGTSEEVLGKALKELGLTNDVRVISKFNPNLNHLNYSAMSKAVDESLGRLGVPYLYCIMLHREEMLSLWDKGLKEILHDILASGRVKHPGVSVYSPEKALQALNTEGIDIVQLPTNILDRRFEKAGVLQLANEKAKQVYIRSIFLQGLILMNMEDIPTKMVFVMPELEKVESLSRESGLTRHEIALGYIKLGMPGAKVVFGAETPKQVKENLTSWEKDIPFSLVSKVRKIFNSVDERVLNPSLWLQLG